MEDRNLLLFISVIAISMTSTTSSMSSSTSSPMSSTSSSMSSSTSSSMSSTTSSCVISKMDLVIILDINVSGADLQNVRDFVKGIIRNINSGSIRVGFVTRFDGQEDKWYLNKYNKTSDIMDAIDQVSYISGYEDIDCAVRTMHDVMFISSHGDRDSAPNIAIIVTDDLPSIHGGCSIPDTNISSVHMYAIGIGLSLTRVRKLKALASPPASDNSFALDSFDDMRGLVPTIFTPNCSGANLTEATTLVYDYIDDEDNLVVESGMTTCTQTLEKDSDFVECTTGVTMLMQNQTQDDMTAICSPSGQKKMECFFQYATTCPELLSAKNGSFEDEWNAILQRFDSIEHMCSVVGGNCVQTLKKDSDFIECVVGLAMLWQNQSQDDMTTICSHYGQKKMECFLQYAKTCPELLSAQNGSVDDELNTMLEHFDDTKQMCSTVDGSHAAESSTLVYDFIDDEDNFDESSGITSGTDFGDGSIKISFNVPEDISPGQLVTEMDGQFVYKKQWPASPRFRLGETRSGNLELRVPNEGLDAETCTQFVITVSKYQGGAEMDIELHVGVNDVNEFPPVFNQSKYTTYVPEGADGSTDVDLLRVQAVDRDLTGNVSYYITDGNLDSTFAITATDGWLRVLANKQLSKPIYSLTVQASDGSKTALTTLVIHATMPICEADEDSYGTLWNRTAGPSRDHRQHACPPGNIGSVYRQCPENGIWLDPVYNCTTDTLISIKQKVQTNSTSEVSALESLVSFTATANGSTPTNLVGNFQTTSDILSLIVDSVDSTEPVEEGFVEDFLDVANNLMDINTTSAWGSIITETGSGVDKVLTSIDSLVEKRVQAGNHSGKNEEFAKTNLYVTIGRSQEAFGDISFPDRNSTILPHWARRSVNSIVLPMNNSTDNVSYSISIFKDLRGMIPELSNESETGEVALNSPVISLTLFTKDPFPLKKPATITFQLFDRGLNTPRCSFWNQGLTGWDTDGCVLTICKCHARLTSWDTDGCILASYDASSGVVVCECSHLTNFAVLMSHAAATEAHMKVLRAISIFGCVTSMICLVLTFAFYLHHWKRVGSDRAILLLNLCVVLFVAYFVFLTGVDRVANKDACTSVAVILHFLYLSVFFIMLAKSVYLAKMLLLPMNRAPITKWCLLAAYGSAAVVVAVSMGTTKLHGYGTDTTCWLSVQSGLLWAFVGPALFVMAANAVVVVIVLKIKFSTVAMAKKTNQEKISSGLRNILVLLPIMGITWVFGVFSVNEDTVVFQYLFALCNSLQGLLIFIFHCLLDHKMKQQVDKSVRKTIRKVQPHALANMKSMSGTNTTMEVNLSSPSTSYRDAP